MSNYILTKRHLQAVVLYYFNSRQSASEAHRMLIDAYGQGIISQTTCYNWYKSFEKGDFNISRYINKRLKKEQRIEELVRLRLEDPGIAQEMMAAKVGISQQAVSKHLRSQEYQNKYEEKKQEQSSIPLEFTTPRQVRSERLIEQLVDLRLEDPGITIAEMASKLGKSQSTVSRYLNSQEYQNKLEEKKQEQRCLPLDLTVKRRRIDSDQD